MTASHIANNVRAGARVLELGKDAKNLYYLNEPKSLTLVVPPANAAVREGPIREAAAKLGVPFSLYTNTPLDGVPVGRNCFDAALCFDMLDGAPEQAAAGAIILLAGALVSNGRLLFLERSSVGFPQLAREYAGAALCGVKRERKATHGNLRAAGVCAITRASNLWRARASLNTR